MPVLPGAAQSITIDDSGELVYAARPNPSLTTYTTLLVNTGGNTCYININWTGTPTLAEGIPLAAGQERSFSVMAAVSAICDTGLSTTLVVYQQP